MAARSGDEEIQCPATAFLNAPRLARIVKPSRKSRVEKSGERLREGVDIARVILAELSKELVHEPGDCVVGDECVARRRNPEPLDVKDLLERYR